MKIIVAVAGGWEEVSTTTWRLYKEWSVALRSVASKISPYLPIYIQYRAQFETDWVV